MGSNHFRLVVLENPEKPNVSLFSRVLAVESILSDTPPFWSIR